MNKRLDKNKPLFNKITKRTWLVIGGIVIVILIVAQILGARAGAASGNGLFQTVRVERGNLTAIVGATGTVRTNQTAILAWQTSGTVEEVNVKVGDFVHAGEVLATLAETSLPQNVILAEAELVSAQRELDNLLHSETAKAQAQLALVNAQQAVDDAQKERDNLDYKRANQETMDKAEADYILAQQQVERMEKYYRNVVAHNPPGSPRVAEAYNALYAAWQQRDQARATLNWYEGQPSEQDITEADASLAVAKAQLADAQREWDRLKDGPDPSDVAAARARVAAIQATINLARLSAPFSGTITEAHPLSSDQVSPGTLGFRIDDLAHLLVDVEVSEVDINSIAVGQPVTVTFDAILGKEYHGVVVQVGQVGNVVQGVVNFIVTVELTDADELIKPGMTAAVTIVVKEINDVLLVPNRAVRLVDGQRVVYILQGGQPEMVEIQLGASSDTMSEVLTGNLEAGDLIVLNPPTEFMPGNGGGPFMGGGRP